jgi:hypothetical protein
MKNLAKKIGVGVLSAFLLGGCATQKYQTNSTKGSLFNGSEYTLTKDILKEETRELNKLERKYNRALERGATMQSPEFVKLFQEYEYQKSKVQNYQDILRMDVKGK